MGWRNKKINRSGGSCGAKLPGCAESSSSVGDDEQSSSSETPVSSEAESSSSEEDVESSSSEEEIDSSSSEDDDDDESSSSSVGDIIPCYKPNLDGGCSVFTYVSRSPMPMVGTLKFKPSDLDDGFFAYYSDGEGYLSFNSNVPVQKKGNFYYDCYYDSNNCGQGDDLPPMIEGDVYYCVWGEPTSMGCATPSFSVPISITENLKYRRTDVSPPNITDEQVLKIANEAARTYSDVMIFCILNGVERTFGTFELPKKENRTIEDVFDFIRPRLDYCRSRDRSSSSQISSSSSSAKSSSSNVKSSSSSKTIEISSSSIEDKSSSSVNNERSSSSKFVESSSSKHMSSSSEGNVFVAGADQEYTPGKIYSSGLYNMEPGKCYSLNPARGTQHGWINTNAQDSWWWREVDCETGDKVDNNRVGACPGFPLDNVPSKPKNACFAYNGSCYKCNPDRGPECSNSWLWQGSFASGNIGWWYEKVDCYDPFEDDFDGQCPDGVLLKKNAASEGNAMSNYKIDYSLSSNFFDAKGRRLNGDRSKFLKAFKKQKKKIKPVKVTAFDVGHIIYIPIEDLGLSRNYLAKDGDACRAKSCGNLGKDYGVNGDVGVYCGYPCTELIEENGYLRIEITKKKQTGSCSEGNPKYTITFKLSAKTTIKRKNVYYVAPIGYKMGSSIVTEDAYKAGKRHEIGHKDSFNCLEKHKMFKSEYIFELEDVCEDEFKCNKKGVIKGLADNIKKSITVQRETGKDELLKYNKNLWLKMCGWYHEKFSRYDGPGGPNNPKDIVCPTTATLLDTNYVLTGCEVFE